jgi:hypothetical protein
MERIEKTVFVSYRRTDEAWALAVFADLTHHGYDVFIDYEGIASGDFETAVLENIRARAHFLVLLTPTALERCADPKDWMRREIEAALESRRNIVPLMFEGFNFSTFSQLTGKLAALQGYNGIFVSITYFPETMERLRNKFLSVPISAVLHPASATAQQAAKERKDNAAIALTVFLCHSSGDKAAVRKLYSRLEADGLKPWLDEEDLLPGQDWQVEIRNAVRACDKIIVCLSPAAVNKEGFIHTEIEYALNIAERKPEGTVFIIPAKPEECSVPERLRKWQWVNLFEGKGYERLLRSLKLQGST